MGIDDLANKALRKHGEPQPQWSWEVEIFEEEPSTVSLFNMPLTSIGAESVIKFHAQEITLPEDRREPIETHFMGKRFYYSGKDESNSEIEITVFDDAKFKMLRYFKQWLNLSGDPAYGRSEKMNQLYKNVRCTMKDSSDFFITGQFDFKKCFPISIGQIDLDYETSDFFKFTVTLKTHYQFLNEQFYGLKGEQ